MTGAQFLNAVALGQITPGPVVQTVAVARYTAAGLVGGILASLVAFTPSFAFILLGADRFDQIRGNRRARAFLDGAGPAAIGAIFGSAVPLARALSHWWQYAVLAGALALLFPLRRGVVLTLLCAAATGVIIALTAGLAHVTAGARLTRPLRAGLSSAGVLRWGRLSAGAWCGRVAGFWVAGDVAEGGGVGLAVVGEPVRRLTSACPVVWLVWRV